MTAALAASFAIGTPFEEPEPPVRPVLTLAEAQLEDAHWERWHRREHYYRAARDYEDYAPAYCVGYVGYAQYGGSFDEAERSLVSNWLRIRGDSRLGLDEAMPAMRAAWRRMEQSTARALRWTPWPPLSAAETTSPLGADGETGPDALQTVPAAWQRAAPQVFTAQP